MSEARFSSSFIVPLSSFFFTLLPGTPNARIDRGPGVLQLCDSLLEWHIHNEALTGANARCGGRSCGHNR
jgi:hypothetical protein